MSRSSETKTAVIDPQRFVGKVVTISASHGPKTTAGTVRDYLPNGACGGGAFIVNTTGDRDPVQLPVQWVEEIREVRGGA